jgi:hypothetical protein
MFRVVCVCACACVCVCASCVCLGDLCWSKQVHFRYIVRVCVCVFVCVKAYIYCAFQIHAVCVRARASSHLLRRDDGCSAHVHTVTEILIHVPTYTHFHSSQTNTHIHTQDRICPPPSQTRVSTERISRPRRSCYTHTWHTHTHTHTQGCISPRHGPMFLRYGLPVQGGVVR